MRECRLCGLCEGRTQVVFGVGNPDAELLFVGEGPGFHEDKQGEPFVGAAGKLLTELLGQIGLTRADVYIANVVKCRPPENRDPLPTRSRPAAPHLMEQIAIIRPRVICTLGRFATKLLAETELSMTAVHGKAKQREIGGSEYSSSSRSSIPRQRCTRPSNRQVLEQDFAKLRYLLSHGLASRPDEVEKEECGSPAASGGTEVRTADKPKSQDTTSNRVEQLPLW